VSAAAGSWWRSCS